MDNPWWYKSSQFNYNLADVMQWEYLLDFEWRGYTVIADRHLPDGTRQHLVKGSVPEGTVVANAQIIGEKD